MNILLLSQFFSTTKGGGEYVFSLIANQLAQDGNNVWVITNRLKNEKYVSHKNINFIFIDPPIEYKGGLPPGFLDNLRYAIGSISKGFNIIRKKNIDIIHSNNFAPALGGSFLSSLTGKPHITTVHDVFSLCGKDYWKKWGKQNNVSKINVSLAPFFEKLMLKLNYNAIHTVSEATKDDLIKFGAKKPIYVVPNSLETTDVLNTEQVPLQFIYIGRLVFYKNLEIVIKAIKLVKKTYPEIVLVIVGGGPNKENLERLVNDLNLQDNVKFTGFISSNDKTKLLASSEALVFPSLCEGFGLVILEAFAQKKPVLVSDVRPLSDIVTSSINGFVIPPHDETQWANAIKEVIEEPEKAHIIGQNGRKTLDEKYSNISMYRKIQDMYSYCITKK